MAQRGTKVEQPSSIEDDRTARQQQREANEKAYQESIKGQDLPPSVVAAQEEDAQRLADAERAAEAGQQEMRETTERISSQGKES